MEAPSGLGEQAVRSLGLNQTGINLTQNTRGRDGTAIGRRSIFRRFPAQNGSRRGKGEGEEEEEVYLFGSVADF